MNQINESNIQAFKSKQFQEINGNNFNIYTPQSLQNMMDPSYIPKHVTRGGRRTGLPCPFSKIGKRCPNLVKKCPHCGHLWVKFFDEIAFFKSLWE